MTIFINATFAGVMSTIGYVLIAVACLMFMIIVHETGHYLAGKILKFKILEFSIGFGPAIFKKTNKKTGEIFALRWIPIGGYCQFEDEDADSKSSTAFNNQKPWKRLIVLFSGAFFNFLSALIIITMIFTFYGQLLPTVAEVYSEASISESLRSGDTILEINGKNTNILMATDFQTAISKIDNEGTFTILRNKKIIKIDVKKSEIYNRDSEGKIVYDEYNNPETKYAFGFTTLIKPVKMNFFLSFARSFSYGFFVVYKIIVLLGWLLSGKIKFSESAGGPITIITAISDATKSGFGPLSYIICLLSANLAVMNLMPFPSLDGSRMLFTTIEWIRGKPINKKIEGIIHFTGLIALFAVAILADIIQLAT